MFRVPFEHDSGDWALVSSVAYAQETQRTGPKSRTDGGGGLQAIEQGRRRQVDAGGVSGRRKDKGKERAEKAFKAADEGSKGYLTLDEFENIYVKRRPQGTR